LKMPPITSQEVRERQSSKANVKMYVYLFMIFLSEWMQFLCHRFLKNIVCSTNYLLNR
jgi:hypothetical protein